MMFVSAQDLPGLTVGSRIFLIITPGTLAGSLRSYRPRPYYILEAYVKEVDDGGKVGLRYLLDAEFILMRGRAVTDLTEAKRRLVHIFAKETDGTLPIEKVRLVSAEEQKLGQTLEHQEPFLRPPEYARA